jgi:hypothetical protein
VVAVKGRLSCFTLASALGLAAVPCLSVTPSRVPIIA